MLAIDIVAIGRLKQEAEEKLQARYLDRIKKAGPALGLKSITMEELTEGKDSDTAIRQADEASRLLARAADNTHLVALDEKGRHFTSREFAALLQSKLDDGTPALTFALGGPDGHDATLLKSARTKLSLSKMTLPHGLARVTLLEQIYRAVTILTGHPYHRD